jgi:hypothetical protein
MEALTPDEILFPDQPSLGLGAVSNPDVQALTVQAEMVAFHKKKAPAFFVLGIAGGVLGARIAGAKVPLGVSLLASLAGSWAYRSLTSDEGAK